MKKVSDIISEIALASQEQAAGIEQVNKAVSEMDKVTQENAALVEQAAAASQSMDTLSSGLSDRMNYFKIGDQVEAPMGHGVAPASKTVAPLRSPSRAKPEAAGSNANYHGVSGKRVSGGDEWEEF